MQKSYAFTYNDSRAWKDQLTKVTYTGYNGTTYTGYYVLNQQGDVIGIIDVQGNATSQYIKTGNVKQLYSGAQGECYE